MELATTANFLAIVIYALAGVYLLKQTKQAAAQPLRVIAVVGAIALLAHGLGAYSVIVVEDGFRFGFFAIPTAFFWVINLLVLLSGLRKPLHNLFLFLFPLSILAILSSLFGDSSVSAVEAGLAGHIVLSLVAYSLLTIATLQAILLAYLNHQLKNKHATGLVRVLPPLQTMDALMFELIWTGQAALTAAIITGIIFVGDFFTQLSSHHAMISMIAWIIYATLLWGHHQWGWRGKIAVRWALGGFTALVLAYFGTKFVYEVILERPVKLNNAVLIKEGKTLATYFDNNIV